MRERRKLADMCLTGTKEEISYTLAVLMFRGCLWETDKKYHPLDEPSHFTYFLQNVTAPVDVPDKQKAEK
ncbi:hypothetical protein QUB49_35440 [Microcoleus sp. AT9_B4]